MSDPMRSFRTLDKDLSRVSNAEYANAESVRPILRFGISVLLIALAALAAAGWFGAHPEIGLIVAGVAVSAYLALSIGGNDVANSLGPAVGAGAIGLTLGLVLVGIMQVAGATLAAGEVTDRLMQGIVLSDLNSDGEIPAIIMVAALFAAATWISLATWAGAPVSTTQALVGAIMGAGIASLGWSAMQWGSIAAVALGWILSPLFAGALAAALLSLIRALLQDRDNPLRAAKIWLPWLIGLMIGFFTLHIMHLAQNGMTLLALAVAAAFTAAGWLHGRITIQRQITQQATTKAALKAIFRLPLAVSAMLLGFAHGANDAPNVVAPLSVILLDTGVSDLQSIGWMPLLAGAGIAIGAILFGRRLVHMVGSRITRLNASRAFCVSLATAITVLGASVFGLPVSTTHVAVGGVFGVGFYREMLDRRAARNRPELPAEERKRRHLVRRSYMRTIFGAWLVTTPAAALLAAGVVWMIN